MNRSLVSKGCLTNFSRALSFAAETERSSCPILDRLDKFTILEPSEAFRPCVSAKYIVPEEMMASIPTPDSYFDLVTCLNVLHHVPNVSTVITEIYRCSSRGRICSDNRSPIISMGALEKIKIGPDEAARGEFLCISCGRSFREQGSE